MTEKIRTLTNKVHLAGILAELDKSDIREGVTQNNIPYISFSGAIQCGETAVSTVRFRSFVKSKKSDGTDSKVYAKIKDWVKSAVPMTADKENPTMVDMIGSITDNPYVGSDGSLREATQFSIQLIGDFREYAAEIDLEGFVHSIRDEVKPGDSEETTGRQRMRLVSRDIFGNALDIKNIVVPEDLVDPLNENGYEKGATATFFINLIPHVSKTPAKSGGIGSQRTDGKSYLEWVMTGADPVIDSSSEDALDVKVIKAAMTERQSRLKEIEEKGYLGGKSSSGRGTIKSDSGTSKSKPSESPSTAYEDNDDDFPF